MDVCRSSQQARERDGAWCERDATQHFAEPGGLGGGELLRRGWRCRAETISDRHELVRVPALIATPAHGRGDAPNRCRTVKVDPADDIADTVGGWGPGKTGGRVVSGWVPGNGVRLAQVQA